MGVDFDVALHAANWRTMAALQQCIDRRGWPVRLGRKDDPRWTEPLAQVPNTIEFKGEPVELEASVVTLSPSKGYRARIVNPPDIQSGGLQGFKPHTKWVFEPVDINVDLARIGAEGVRFGNGDKVLTLTFGSDRKEWQAGFYVMAALIKCFNGYGFEMQEGRHGTSDYADALLQEIPEKNK